MVERSQSAGMTKLFITMVERARDSTMIMAVAAEPPTNTMSARTTAHSASGC
jgi:hypothetical protein